MSVNEKLICQELRGLLSQWVFYRSTGVGHPFLGEEEAVFSLSYNSSSKNKKVQHGLLWAWETPYPSAEWAPQARWPSC